MNPATDHITRVSKATTMTLKEWHQRYYRPDRLHREPDTASNLLAYDRETFEKTGIAIISHHSTVTGKTEWYADKRGVVDFKRTRKRLAVNEVAA